MAKHTVIFQQDHVVEIPATVLETRLSSDGPVESSINIPASKIVYTKGQKVVFRNKKDLSDFLATMGNLVSVETP